MIEFELTYMVDEFASEATGHIDKYYKQQEE